jgi:muconolactone delta-isomerase
MEFHMNGFFVECTFKPGTDMSEVMKLVEEEKSKVAELKAEGRLGQIFLAVPQGKVFIELNADSAESADATVRELPMSVWWDLEVFTLSGRA